jgi:NTE family protein
MFNPLKYMRNRKVGVALGSGGSKGIAHIAVLDYLKNEGIPVDMISGSSIGAVVGALFSVGAMKEYRSDLLKMDWKEMLSLVDPVFPRIGLVKGKKLRAFLARYIPESAKLEDLPVPLSVVATDYRTGLPVVFTRGNVLDALRASIAIPGVFTPVKYGDSLLIDGGVSNPLPLDELKRMNAGLTIAVNLHPTVPGRLFRRVARNVIPKASPADPASLDMRDESDSAVPGKGEGPERGKFWKITHFLKGPGKNRDNEEEHDPNIFHIISQSIDIMEYINTVMILKYYRPSVIIQPNLIDMTTLDFTRAGRALSEGYAACRRVRRQLRTKIKFWV